MTTIEEMGRMGGIARAAKLSPERRKEIAMMGVSARYGKYHKSDKTIIKELQHERKLIFGFIQTKYHMTIEELIEQIENNE